MEKKTPQEILAEKHLNVTGVTVFHSAEQHAQISIDFAAKETERLQAENKAMRELLKEIELEIKFTQGYNPFVSQISTLLNQ